MSIEELQWLHDRASEMQSVVEIGSWFGRSTHALCTGCKGLVWAVDHFKGSPNEMDAAHRFARDGGDVYAHFRKNVGHFPHLLVLRMDSVEAAQNFRERSVDMVFIDGDHSLEGVQRDLAAWVPKCRVLLCGHDRSQDGVGPALEALQRPITSEVGSLWSIRCDQ